MGKWLADNPPPEACEYVVDVYRIVLSGGAVEKYGAGPTVFEVLREEHDNEAFMLLLEFINIIDSERAAAQVAISKRQARTNTPPANVPRGMRGRRSAPHRARRG